ncbi:MAG TPA: type II toxin-antitoxin system VapC family toxin [Acidobacteriaceae bacterium]
MSSYFDTSFLVSLYSVDANSAAAVAAPETVAGALLITTFSELEFVNAMGLRVFRKEISAEAAQSSIADFEEDLRTGVFQLKPLTERLFARARELSRQTTPRLGTRAADLLHVAAALELGCDLFLSFDRQQRTLAHSVKLKLNPFPGK